MRRARRIKRWLPTTARIARRARAPAHDGDDDDDDARERARFSASDADARAMRRASARESTREDARGRRTRNRRARIARRAETRERCARERDAEADRDAVVMLVDASPSMFARDATRAGGRPAFSAAARCEALREEPWELGVRERHAQPQRSARAAAFEAVA